MNMLDFRTYRFREQRLISSACPKFAVPMKDIELDIVLYGYTFMASRRRSK